MRCAGRRRLVVMAASLACGLSVVAAPFAAAMPASAPAGAGAGCAVSRPFTVTRDQAVQTVFRDYGNSNALLDDWTGADGVYSVPLPDGRILWDFADSFLGAVNADESRPGGVPFIHNTLVLQSGNALTRTLHGGTAQAPTSFVSPDTAGDWYWPADMTVEGDQVRMFLNRFSPTGPGAWDWEWTGTDIASYRLPDFAPIGITSTRNDGVQWGAALLEDGGFTYIYGVEDVDGQNKYLHVARAPQGAVTGGWRYFNGSGWSSDPASSARVLQGVDNGFGVEKVGGTYLLLTLSSLTPFSDKILVYASCSPEGPFQSPVLVYRTPESGSVMFTYSAHVHPELNDAGGLLISYDVNAWNAGPLFSNVNTYRPRFLRLKFGG